MNEITIRLSDGDRALLAGILNELQELRQGDFAIPQEWKGEKVAAKVEPEPVKEEPKQESLPWGEEKPDVTLEQIQKKVVQLAAAAGGTKKAKVRAIINDYGSKVSDLKDKPEKWAEVWQRLAALEKEA